MFNVTPAGLAALVITKDQEMSNRFLAMAGASHTGPTAMLNVLSLKRQTDLIDELQTKVKVLSAPKAAPPPEGPQLGIGTPAAATPSASPQTPVTVQQTPPPPAPVPVPLQSDVDRQIGAIVAQMMALQHALTELRQNIRDNGGNAYEVARRRLVVADLPAVSKTASVNDSNNTAYRAAIGKLLDDLKALFIQEFSLDYPPAPGSAPAPGPTPTP